jgi:universal stress protein A
MKSFTTVLSAIDFSENSDAAFECALTIASGFNSSLVVMHVIDSLMYAPGFDMPYPFIEDLDKELYAGAMKMMDRFCESRLSGFPKHAIIIETGTPHREIIRAAEHTAASLIVLGTHGRSGLDRVVYGSTAERVVRGTPCPVLTVPLHKKD